MEIAPNTAATAPNGVKTEAGAGNSAPASAGASELENRLSKPLDETIKDKRKTRTPKRNSGNAKTNINPKAGNNNNNTTVAKKGGNPRNTTIRLTVQPSSARGGARDGNARPINPRPVNPRSGPARVGNKTLITVGPPPGVKASQQKRSVAQNSFAKQEPKYNSFLEQALANASAANNSSKKGPREPRGNKGGIVMPTAATANLSINLLPSTGPRKGFKARTNTAAREDRARDGQERRKNSRDSRANKKRNDKMEQ